MTVIKYATWIYRKPGYFSAENRGKFVVPQLRRNSRFLRIENVTTRRIHLYLLEKDRAKDLNFDSEKLNVNLMSCSLLCSHRF